MAIRHLAPVLPTWAIPGLFACVLIGIAGCQQTDSPARAAADAASTDAPDTTTTAAIAPYWAPAPTSLDLTIDTLDVFRAHFPLAQASESTSPALRTLVVGKTVYFLNQWHGMQVIDLTDPAKPALAKEVPIAGEPLQLLPFAGGALAIVQHRVQPPTGPGPLVAVPTVEILRLQLGGKPTVIASSKVKGALVAVHLTGPRLWVVTRSGAPEEATQAPWTLMAGIPTPGGPGPWLFGAQVAVNSEAPATRVVAVSLADSGTLVQSNSLEWPGTVIGMAAGVTQVVVAAGHTESKPNAPQLFERSLTQVVVGADGALSQGAKWSQTWSSAEPSATGLTVDAAVAAGAAGLAVLSVKWTPKVGDELQLHLAVPAGGTFAFKPVVQLSKRTMPKLFAGDARVVLVSSPATASGAAAEMRFDVVATADGSVGTTTLTGVQAQEHGPRTVAVQPQRWLIETAGSPRWRMLDIAEATAPKWLGGLDIGPPASAGGLLPRLVEPGLLVVPATGPAGTPEAGKTALQLVAVGPSGALTAGAWVACGIEHQPATALVRAGDALLHLRSSAAETFSIADQAKPVWLAKLELAAATRDALGIGDRLAALAAGGLGDDSGLRVLPPGQTDVRQAQAKLNQLVGHVWLAGLGNLVAVVGPDRLQIMDVSTPSSPKLRGAYPGPGLPKDALWPFRHSLYTATQAGATLWVAGIDSEKNSNYDPGCSAGPGQSPCAPEWTANARIVALDLTNPDLPATTGFADLPNVAWIHRPQKVGNTLYFNTYSGTLGTGDQQPSGQHWLQPIDIAEPAKPVAKQPWNIPGYLIGVTAAGKAAVVLAPNGNKPHVLQAVVLSASGAQLAGTLPLQAYVGPAECAGDRVYLGTWPLASGGPSQLRVIDASNPAQLNEVATIDVGVPVSNLWLGSEHLVARLGPSTGLALFASPAKAAPTWLSTTLFDDVQTGRHGIVSLGGKLLAPAGWRGVVELPL